MPEGINLPEKVFDAVFGNGKDGLLTRTANLEVAIRSVGETATDTNDLLRNEIIPKLNSAMTYQSDLPTDERKDLMLATRLHLKEANEHDRLFGIVSMATFKLILNVLQFIVVAGLLAKLGLQ